MSDPVRTVQVKRLGYSRSPWRLVDSQTDQEVTIERAVLDHPISGVTKVPVAGYSTKTEAVAALGRLAARQLATEQEAGR